jgi:hypothetical protein
MEAGPVAPGPKLKPSDVKSYADEPLYDMGVLRTLFLDFENADWEKELADFYHTDVEIPAKLTVDGKVYRDVGVHFRGQSSFMSVPEGRKRSIGLTINYVHGDQRLLGRAVVDVDARAEIVRAIKVEERPRPPRGEDASVVADLDEGGGKLELVGIDRVVIGRSTRRLEFDNHLSHASRRWIEDQRVSRKGRFEPPAVHRKIFNAVSLHPIAELDEHVSRRGPPNGNL